MQLRLSFLRLFILLLHSTDDQETQSRNGLHAQSRFCIKKKKKNYSYRKKSGMVFTCIAVKENFINSPTFILKPYFLCFAIECLECFCTYCLYFFRLIPMRFRDSAAVF